MSIEALKRRVMAIESRAGSSDMLDRMRKARHRVEAGLPRQPFAPVQGAGRLANEIRNAQARVLNGVAVDGPTSGPLLAEPLYAEHGQID